MASDINLPPETEREQLQEDIERLQLVLQADDELNSEESDNETSLQIDTEYAIENSRNKPGSSSTENKAGIDLEDVEVMQFGEETELPVNAETSLALNRAYQELLLDSLRKIEVVLSENRDKQNLLEAELAEHGGKPEKSSSVTSSGKTPILTFAMPYFKNASGKNPPVNVDVQMKAMLDEKKQDTKPPAIWTSSQRTILLDAIKQDSLEQILRPLMNRKELEMERIMGLQKESQTDERIACQSRIVEIDREMEAAEKIPTEELLRNVNESKIDWLKISNMVFEGKRDVLECQALWKNAMHPSINKEKWTKAEEEKLMALVERHQMRNWNKIAEYLGTNRTAFQCLQYYQQNLNDTYSKREWTEEEDYLLAEVIESCKQGSRISWNQVSYYIEGRSANQCLNRWHQIDPGTKRGRWHPEEDCTLLAAVKLHGEGNWSKIQQHVQGRSANQCRDRYVNALDPKIRPPTTWSYDEDKRLIKLVNQYGGPTKCSWVKVASGLEGRTDNMVLCRFRRLMEWKKKCDWLETKSDEAKESLGLVNIRASKRKTAENLYGKYETLNRNEAIAYRLAEFNSGVHREDYLKQLEDKYNGELVVPRPPLLFRYNARSMTKTWERREQLHKLIEAHIYQIRKVKGHDLIPEKTGELLGTFAMMSERQKDKLKAYLVGKKPSEITVRDVLNVTGRLGRRGRAVMTEKRIKKMKRDNDLDAKVKSIIQWKAYRSITNRICKGRPKKFNIFTSKRKTDQYSEEVEDVEQMTKTTSNLLLSALNVNGKKAIQKYERLPEDVKESNTVLEDMNLLSKVIDNRPSSMATCSSGVNSTSQSSLTTTHTGIVHGTVNKTQHVDNKNGDKQVVTSEQNKITRVLKDSEIVNENTQNQKRQVLVSRGDKSGNLVNTNTSASVSDRISTRIKPKSEIIGNSDKSLSASSSGTGVVTCEIVPDKNSTVVSEMSKSSSVSGTRNNSSINGSSSISSSMDTESSGNSSASVSTVSVNAVGGPVTMVTRSSSSATQTCVNKPTPKQLAFLPPNLTTLRGFEWLLMQRKLLISKAGSNYNGFFYRQQAAEQQMLTGSDHGQYNVDLNSVMKNIDQKVGSVAMKGKRAMSKKFNKMVEPKGQRKKGPDASRDPLKNIRKTVDYELLKTRFQSLFTWPALLATTVPSDAQAEAVLQEAADTSVAESEAPEEQQSNYYKRYPCVRSKNYYKRMMKGNTWREEVTKKIQATKRKNRIARLQGLPVESSNKKVRKRKPKFIDEKDKRSSARIQERKNVEKLMKTVQERDQETLQQKKGGRKFKRGSRAMTLMLGQEERQVMREPVTHTEVPVLPVVDDTVIEIVSDFSFQAEQQEHVPYPNTVIEIVPETQLINPGQGQTQYLNGNLPIQICSFEPLTNISGDSIRSENTATSQNVVISTEGFLTSISGDGPDVVMATPIGHIDKETGTLKPHTGQSGAYPVALVVNQTTLDSSNS